MNKYESVIIINPNVDEAGLKALEEKFTGLINENGKVEEVVDMGKRKLADRKSTRLNSSHGIGSRMPSSA